MKVREKRLFERVPCNFPVEIVEKESGQKYEGRGCDFSLGGMGLITRRYLPPRESVDIRVKLQPQTSPLRMDGRIVWAYQDATGLWRTGVEFSLWDFPRFIPLMAHRHA